MEKVEYNSPEEKEACDLIKHHRDYQRLNYTALFISDVIGCSDEGRNICIDIRCAENEKTKYVSVTTAIRCGRHAIPNYRFNQPLKCTNKHAMDYRKQIMNFYNHKRGRRIEFTEKIDINVFFLERLTYFEDTGNISIYSYFYGTNGVKLKLCQL